MLVVTIAASPSVPEAPIRTVMSRVFAATCTKFERRISCQKRDGRLITRLSPFDHLTEE